MGRPLPRSPAARAVWEGSRAGSGGGRRLRLPAGGRTTRPTTPTAWTAFAVLFLLAALLAVPTPVTATDPVDRDTGGAARTVTWRMDDPGSLILENISLDSGDAELEWRPVRASWTGGIAIASNGTVDANLSANEAGVELAADLRNYLAGGDFARPDPWTFANGSDGLTVSEWNSSAQAGRVSHSSPASQATHWDSLDSVESTWIGAGSPGSTSNISTFTSSPNGARMMQDEITTGPSGAAWAGAFRTGSFDWSPYDRLLIWIRAPLSLPPGAASFNISALMNTTTRSTGAIPLRPDWQEVVVDLSELGLERNAVSMVTLRINGRSLVHTFLLDDIRLATAKGESSTAGISQVLAKENETSPANGTAMLSLNWKATTGSNVSRFSLAVNMSGPGGSFERLTATSSVGVTNTFSTDVSEGMWSPGTYMLAVRVRFILNTTYPSGAEVFIDNVTILFPDRRNGTFVSDPIELGSRSRIVNVSWTTEVPEETSVLLGLRSGNTSTPEDGTWSAWVEPIPVDWHPTSLAAQVIQVRAELRTANASRSPRITAFLLEGEHRAARGTVMTAPVLPVTQRPFLGWRTFDASWTAAGDSRVAFEVFNGSSWRSVLPGTNLTSLANASQPVQVRAILTTADGLITPALSGLTLIYEYLGDVVSVRISRGRDLVVRQGETLQLTAVALDAGQHVVPNVLLEWDTDPRGGSIDNSGRFFAGRPGLWNVTSQYSPLIYDTVQVRVREGPLDIAQILVNPIILLGIVAVAGGYGGYRVLAKRLFSVEDLFLVARDGRLVHHNTRRLRAEWDEDTFAGMLTAISAFVRDSFREDRGHLERFEFAGKTCLIERIDSMYVAAIYAGRVPRWAQRNLLSFVADLEGRIGPRLAAWSGSPEDLQELKDLTNRFVGRTRYRPQKSR